VRDGGVALVAVLNGVTLCCNERPAGVSLVIFFELTLRCEGYHPQENSRGNGSKANSQRERRGNHDKCRGGKSQYGAIFLLDQKP
jgi:hypothetical protein